MKPQLVTSPEPPEINVIIEAMRAATLPTTGGDPGLTSAEWSAHLGINNRDMLRRLHAVQAAGRLAVGTQHRPALDGRVRRFTVYRLT